MRMPRLLAPFLLLAIAAIASSAFAQTPINQLPPAGTLRGTEQMPGYQQGTGDGDVAITPAQIATYVAGNPAYSFALPTPAGSAQGTATVLTAQFNYVTGATTNAQGVLLPRSIGVEFLINNLSALYTLYVYPPFGAQIGSLGTNTPTIHAPLAVARYFCVSTTQCYQQ